MILLGNLVHGMTFMAGQYLPFVLANVFPPLILLSGALGAFYLPLYYQVLGSSATGAGVLYVLLPTSKILLLPRLTQSQDANILLLILPLLRHRRRPHLNDGGLPTHHLGVVGCVPPWVRADDPVGSQVEYVRPTYFPGA